MIISNSSNNLIYGILIVYTYLKTSSHLPFLISYINLSGFSIILTDIYDSLISV
jgi:hypothetical protein